MAYSNAIPQPTDRIKDSQAALLANFVSIQNSIELNHGDFNSAFEGKHITLTMSQHAADPAAPAGTDLNVYRKAAGFFTRDSAGTVSDISANEPERNAYTYIFSGFLLKWGWIPVGATGGGAQSIAFPVTTGLGQPIPAFATDCVHLSVTPYVVGAGAVFNDVAVNVVSVTTTHMNVYMTTRTTQALKDVGFTFFAIGY